MEKTNFRLFGIFDEKRNGSINNTIFVGRNVVDVNEVIRANVVVERVCVAHVSTVGPIGTRKVGETHKINLVYVWLDCFSPLLRIPGRINVLSLSLQCVHTRTPRFAHVRRTDGQQQRFEWSRTRTANAGNNYL